MSGPENTVPVLYFAPKSKFNEIHMKSQTTASIQQTKQYPVRACAGMVNAVSNRKPRNLLKFDVATLLAKKTQK